MPLGFPCDLSTYKLLTDWGSFIAGALALLAGILAYLAGRRGANATRDAMDRQLAAQAGAQAAEVANVRAALRAEVIVFAKYVIGALGNCEAIAKQITTMPRSDANAIVRGMHEPTVFPAVADRIAALGNPHLPVQFFARVEEAKAMANTLSLATVAYGVINVQIPVILVDRANALAIADCLITALVLGQPIVADAPADMSLTERHVTTQTLADIETAMASAHATFPDAESFEAPAGADPTSHS